MHYYIWLSVATAVHHLVVTYWQAAVPSSSPSSPPPPSPLLSGAPALALAVEHTPGRTPWMSPWMSPWISLGAAAADAATADRGDTSSGCGGGHPASGSLNGYTQAVASLLGGAAALLPMLGERLINARGCSLLRESLMVIGPLALSASLYAMSVVERADLYAASYVLFHVSFELMRVLCEAEGARCVAATRCVGTPRFAAVSGLNTTLSLGLQSILQFLFNTPQRLPLAEQFRLLAAMLFALFLAYASRAAWSGLCGRGQPRDDDALPEGPYPEGSYPEGEPAGSSGGRHDSPHSYHRYHEHLDGRRAPSVAGEGR